MQFPRLALVLTCALGLAAATSPNKVKRDETPVETAVAALAETYETLIQGVEDAATEGLSQQEIDETKEAMKAIYDQIVASVQEEAVADGA